MATNEIKQNVPRRHHFIPRVLLKGFASRCVGDNKYLAFQFLKNGGISEASIKDIGTEVDFHGKPGQSNLEGNLSKRENEYAEVLYTLRQGECPTAAKRLIVELVVNLMVRTRAVRQGLTDTFESALRIIFEDYRQPRLWAKIREGARKQILQNPHTRQILNSLPRNQRKAYIEQFIESPVVKDQLDQITNMAKGMIDLHANAKDSHIKALNEDLAPTRHQAFLNDLQWRICEYFPGALILGDLGPIARVAGSLEWQQPLITNAARRSEAICLPVSSSHLLVGYMNGHFPQLDPETINMASAELSCELFVASKNTEREKCYQGQIGKRAALMQEDEMRRLLTEEEKERP